MSRVLCIAVGVIALAACGPARSDVDEAAQVAQRFHEAVASGDGARACELLAPEVEATVAAGGDTSCAAAIAQEDLPAGGDVRRTDVFGDEAMVELASDTVFVARYSGAWRVAAAGCQERPAKPYRCTIGTS